MFNKLREKNFYLPFYISLFVYNIATNCVHPITPTMIIERGLSNAMFGYAFAAMSLMYFLAAPLWGRLCNYHSTKKLFLIGSIGYTVGQVIFGFCTSDAMAIAGRMIGGTFTGGVYTCFSNYIINTSMPGNSRSKAMTLNITIQNIAAAVGFFVGGMLGTISVNFAVAVTIALLVLSTSMIWLSMADDSKVREIPKEKLRFKDANPFAAFVNAKNYMTKALFIFLSAVVLLAFGQICLEQVFNFYIKDQLGMSSAYNGTFKAVIAIASLVANSTLCLYLVKNTDMHKSFSRVVLCQLLPLGLMIVIKAPLPFSACYIVFSTVNNMRSSMQQTIIADKSTPRYSNDLMGLYQSLNSFGNIFGALFAGMIYDFNPFLPFKLSFALFAAGVIVSFVYAADHRKEKSR